MFVVETMKDFLDCRPFDRLRDLNSNSRPFDRLRGLNSNGRPFDRLRDLSETNGR